MSLFSGVPLVRGLVYLRRLCVATERLAKAAEEIAQQGKPAVKKKTGVMGEVFTPTIEEMNRARQTEQDGFEATEQ